MRSTKSPVDQSPVKRLAVCCYVRQKDRVESRHSRYGIMPGSWKPRFILQPLKRNKDLTPNFCGQDDPWIQKFQTTPQPSSKTSVSHLLLPKMPLTASPIEVIPRVPADDFRQASVPVRPTWKRRHEIPPVSLSTRLLLEIHTFITRLRACRHVRCLLRNGMAGTLVLEVDRELL